MNHEFPDAVPEVPVNDLDRAIAYYVKNLGFGHDWGGEPGGAGIAGISREHCRIFLTDRGFREMHRNDAPVVIWINLYSVEEVNELHEAWRGSHAKIVFAPETKPWKLYEFTAADLDGNFLRVFHGLSRED